MNKNKTTPLKNKFIAQDSLQLHKILTGLSAAVYGPIAAVLQSSPVTGSDYAYAKTIAKAMREPREAFSDWGGSDTWPTTVALLSRIIDRSNVDAGTRKEALEQLCSDNILKSLILFPDITERRAQLIAKLRAGRRPHTRTTILPKEVDDFFGGDFMPRAIKALALGPASQEKLARGGNRKNKASTEKVFTRCILGWIKLTKYKKELYYFLWSQARVACLTLLRTSGSAFSEEALAERRRAVARRDSVLLVGRTALSAVWSILVKDALLVPAAEKGFLSGRKSYRDIPWHAGTLEASIDKVSELLSTTGDQVLKTRCVKLQKILEKIKPLLTWAPKGSALSALEEAALYSLGNKIVTRFDGVLYKRIVKRTVKNYKFKSVVSLELLDGPAANIVASDYGDLGVFPITDALLAGIIITKRPSPTNRSCLIFRGPETALTAATVSGEALRVFGRRKEEFLCLARVKKEKENSSQTTEGAREESPVAPTCSSWKLRRLFALCEHLTRTWEEMGCPETFKIYYPLNTDFRSRLYPRLPLAITQDVHTRFLFTSGIAAVGEHEVLLYRAFLAGLLGCPKTAVRSLVKHAEWYQALAAEACTQFPNTAPAHAIEALAAKRILPKYLFKFWTILDTLHRYEKRDPNRPFRSAVSIALDCTNSGAQLIAALLGDTQLLITTNVLSSREESTRAGLDCHANLNDLYENLRVHMQNAVRAQAASMFQRPGIEVKVEKIIARAFILSPYFSRTFVKKVTVPALYGQGHEGLTDLIATMLRATLTREGHSKNVDFHGAPRRVMYCVAAEVSRAYRLVLKEKYPSIGRFFAITKLVAAHSAESRRAGGLRWTAVDGSIIIFFPVKCGTRRLRSVTNSTKQTRTSSIRTPAEDIITRQPLVDTDNLIRGFAANFVHSIDATICRGIVAAGGRSGLTFSTVHDSFMVHPAHADFLQKTFHKEYRRAVNHARQQLISMYNLAIAEQPTNNNSKHNPEIAALTFPPAIDWRNTQPGLAIFV